MNTQYLCAIRCGTYNANSVVYSMPIFRTITLDPLSLTVKRPPQQQRRRQQHQSLWQREWKSFNLMNANELKNCKHLLIRFRRVAEELGCAHVSSHTSRHAFISCVRTFCTSLRICWTSKTCCGYHILCSFASRWDAIHTHTHTHSVYRVIVISYIALAHSTLYTHQRSTRGQMVHTTQNTHR